MVALTELPLELREEIWSLVCQIDAPFDLLRTNRRMSAELAPYLYRNIVVHLFYPGQILRWIHKIGNYNSSCIRNLTLKFPSLVSSAGTFDHGTTKEIWSASLDALRQLDTLIFYYEPSKHYTQQCLGLEEVQYCRFTTFERAITKAGALGQATSLQRNSRDLDILESLPAADSRPITHAVLAIDEPMPEINMLTFMKLFSLNMNTSLYEKVHGLPPAFFAQVGLELARTYTMIEDPQQQSLALTYRKQYSSSFNQPPDLQFIFLNLPRLLYLRLGCPNVNSSCLTYLPSTLQTIDISFQDPDPQRVSRNLRHMRQRCEKLFTLAIAVSPLHDLVEMPDGGRPIDQRSKGEEGVSEWEPFWDALRDIQGTGVKVWEGEGPGFKRVR